MPPRYPSRGGGKRAGFDGGGGGGGSRPQGGAHAAAGEGAAARSARVSLLYEIRCGRSASAPSRARRFSSYASKLPSNQVTCESPSNASTCVAIRSRNQRSCEMITAHPGNDSSASSSA